ncbi:hypothetical protein [Cryobacterium breve]|uniref:hypothetical protein n=1 Tax=Cryobacterium breve TaxID=1259258 RepID=UPI00248C53E9|nr:hypothetical protein [Cryobacterium breve]
MIAYEATDNVPDGVVRNPSLPCPAATVAAATPPASMPMPERVSSVPTMTMTT